jgi:hypothetical protein
MNSTLATEVTEKPAARSLLETWGKNERMRHVPPIDWIIQKLDGDLRLRIDLLFKSFAALPPGDTHSSALDAEFRGLCRAIDRIGETAKHTRGITAPTDLRQRIEWSLSHTLTALQSLDANLFGRRYPFQTFERSKGEALYGALLTVIDRVHRVTAMIRGIDRRIDERLLEGLVTLQEPLREQAIA